MPRREFLYDIKFWEARRIIRGYRKRNRIFMQLLAENVYATIHMMRDPKGKTVSDMFPVLFEDDYEKKPPMTESDKHELLDLINSVNKKGGK